MRASNVGGCGSALTARNDIRAALGRRRDAARRGKRVGRSAWSSTLFAVSGLETLPPDQRAVLQLILVQGRGYADLAATLRLDPAAVRERAHAGAAALGAPVGDGLDAATRGRVVDYLLGQQDDGERLVTFAALGESPAACRWAQALREQLAGVAREQLPEVPAAATVPATVNGSGAADAAADPAVPDAAAATAALAAIPPAPVARHADAGPAAPSPPAAPPPPAAPGESSGPRPSRVGGAILIAGVLALVVVLAIVLIGGGDDGGSPASTGAAQTQAQTSRAQTQPSSSGTSARGAQARTVGGAVLRSPSGGSGLGAALVQRSANGRRLLAVEAARLPGNAAQEFYGIWLQGAAGNRFLGFVPNQVRANGTFTVSSQLPGDLDLAAYTTVLVTSEDGSASASPTTPGATVLSGPLRVAG